MNASDGTIAVLGAIGGMLAIGIPALWALFRASERARTAVRRLERIEGQDGTIARIHQRIDEERNRTDDLVMDLVSQGIVKPPRSKGSSKKRPLTGAVPARVEDASSAEDDHD